MESERIKLIIRNMELLLDALKKELKDSESQTISLNELLQHNSLDDYEPDYYEEE
jgi:hypothetical protein